MAENLLEHRPRNAGPSYRALGIGLSDRLAPTPGVVPVGHNRLLPLQGFPQCRHTVR
jgi:hypothetical protein